MRNRSILLLLGGALAWAGQNTLAPPGVDQALRERVTKFYQAQVDGKFRQGEQYIAEESKDIYYAAQKHRLLKFSIKDIAYSKDLTEAKVTVSCTHEVRHHVIGTMQMTLPQTAPWKIQNGLWVLYIDPNAPIQTPFGGVRRAQPGEASAPPPVGASNRPKGEDLLNAIAHAVHADKTEVRLGSPDETASVLLTNTMPGAVTLSLEPAETQGFDVRLERNQLAPNEAGRILFRTTERKAATRPPVIVTVKVEPTGQAIPIRVTFAPPAK